MSAKRKKKLAWSKIIEEHGIEVRIFDRKGTIYRSVVIDGRKDRKSLGHSDRALAETQAKGLCAELAKHTLDGTQVGGTTFGHLHRLYLRQRGPVLTASRRLYMTRTLELLAAFLEPDGQPFKMDDFSQDHLDGYVNARLSGTIRSKDPHASTDGVRAGTIRNELQALSTLCNWGIMQKAAGRRLLSLNPVRGLRFPEEKNPRRPRASLDRYQKLLSVADTVVPSGQFRLMLEIAHHTGRRINAICHLRASDLLLAEKQVRAALAAAGMDEEYAKAWPHAIRWRATFDKQKFESIAPIPASLKTSIEAYLRRASLVGDTWLFPFQRRGRWARLNDPNRPAEPTPKSVADWWLERAEKAAELPHLERGGWHAFRRAWAQSRKALPVQDVMAAGGWRDAKALQRAYQGADAETIRAVVEAGEKQAS